MLRSALHQRLLSLDPGRLLAYLDAPSSRPSMRTLPAGVAELYIDGPLSYGLSWGYSYADVELALAEVLNDLSVRHIVVRLESPGGDVPGLIASCRRMRAMIARRGIPVSVHTSSMCLSAGAIMAHALAANGGQVVAEPTARVGNLGLYQILVDSTQMDEETGVKLIYVSAGGHKTDLYPGSTLDPDAVARVQAQVDGMYEILCRETAGWLAARRQIEPEQAYALVRGQDSLTYSGGDEAIQAGACDSVMYLDELLAWAAGGRR